eukprot:TRINITY_DN1536_c0_g1_i1.p1 TRINITY_DN1536_c0_g1~~TRINITY_DN1536_c0_g1_i1.p1  ORF type:complete len:468 (-),score=79.23 TRINITY_DN1536_c0_g1_i1:151-1554(-)
MSPSKGVTLGDVSLDGVSGPSSFQRGANTSSMVSRLSETLKEPVENSDEELDDLPSAQKPRTGTFLSSWSVLANTILGIGLLALPWAAAQVGWVLGFGMLFLAAFFGNVSLYLLACVALEMGGSDTTFYSVCMTVAPKCRVIVDFAIAVKCFGVATSYLLVIKQALMSVFKPNEDDKLMITCLVILVSVLAITPVTFRRRLAKSTVTNWVALTCIFYVWILFMYYCIGSATGLVTIENVTGKDMPTSVGPASVIDVLTTIPVYIFAFTCHQNMFPVANEIQEPSTRKLGWVATAAVATAVAMYGVCAAFGYAVFGSTISNNFLTCLPDNPAVHTGRLLMAFSNVLSYPLQTHPCRRSLSVLVGTCTGVHYEYPQKGERMMRRTLTGVICLGTGLVAIVVDDLGAVFEIIGAVGSNTICYIMPAYLYIRTFGRGQSSPVLMLARLQLCIGIMVLPTCLFSIFWKMAHP